MPMPYAIVLYLDHHSEDLVKGFWKQLAQNDISSEILDSGIRPHITLAIFEELYCQPCDNELARLAPKTAHLKILVSHLGVFPQPEMVLFLAPTPTSELLNFHKKIHSLLSKDAIKPWEMYQPGKWVPHCTLALNLDQNQLNKAISLCGEIELPLQMRATQIGAVQFKPVTDLFRYELKED